MTLGLSYRATASARVVDSARRIVDASGAPSSGAAPGRCRVFKRGCRRVPRDAIDSISRSRSCSKARWNSGRLRREERQRHPAQAVRDLRQHRPARGPASSRLPGRGIDWSWSVRTSGPLRRHRAHADPGVARCLVISARAAEDRAHGIQYARAEGRPASPAPRNRTS
jgi:hypothetical protein